MRDIRCLENTIEEKGSRLHRLRVDSISHIQNRETIGRESLDEWNEEWKDDHLLTDRRWISDLALSTSSSPNNCTEIPTIATPDLKVL